MGMGLGILALLGISIVILVPIFSILVYQLLFREYLIPKLQNNHWIIRIAFPISLILGAIFVLVFDYLLIELIDLWIEMNGGYIN
jgi:hypothetical protein